MTTIGTVESLWRYPVKSMRGEELNEIFAGYAGVYGDRQRKRAVRHSVRHDNSSRFVLIGHAHL